MPLSPGFIDFALELFAGVGRIEAKRMFGGAGLYRDGIMFGVLDDDAIYLRTDDGLAAEFRSQGSVPWSYSMKRDGAVREMGYWRIPESALDDPDEAAGLARRAVTAAVARKVVRAKAPLRRKPAAKALKLPAAPKASRPRAKK